MDGQEEPNFPELQVKFVKEAFRLVQCKHPHIVEVYDLFQEGELWGTIVEYIDGEDLWVHINEHGIFSEDEALSIIRQVGEALTCVHQEGFLHRDVKPHNIVLRRDTREAVLIDFGLAREYIDGRTMSQTNYRTECFAPIEQYKLKAKRGPFTDVYALAARLYYLLTDQKPFPAEVRKQNVPLIPPQQHNSQISERVNQAILKGMELYPENRPQSVSAFWQLLFPAPSKEKQSTPGTPSKEKQSTPSKEKQIVLRTFAFEVLTVNSRGKVINRQRQQAEYFADNLGNGRILQMVFIPGGSFLMGSPKTERKRDGNESPQHRVTVASFYMGKYAVTQAQWQAVAALPPANWELNPNPSYFKDQENRPVE